MTNYSSSTLISIPFIWCALTEIDNSKIKDYPHLQSNYPQINPYDARHYKIDTGQKHYKKDSRRLLKRSNEARSRSNRTSR